MTDLLNKKYRLEIEALAPLHIGAGQEKDLMKGADYIIDKGKILVLNHKKVAHKLSANELTNFLINKDEKGIKNKLGADLHEVADLVFDAPAESTNDIKSFVKNGLTNKPIVPGSSIKGAIRSILLNFFIENRNAIDKTDRSFEQKIFGSANNGDEFMRFIKIGDAQFEKTELTNTKVFNLFGNAPDFNGGWKHELSGGTNNNFMVNGFNTIYEIIQPNQKSEFSLALSEKAFNSFIKENDSSANKVKIFKESSKKEILKDELSNKLFAIINEHTKLYIGKQIAFFNQYSNNQTPQIIESLKKVLDHIPNDNSSCVLKMSGGSGFHSITGDWQFDDYSINGIKTGRGPSQGQLFGQDSAKSRKIATDGEKFEMMGFVKLTILSKELIEKREAERKAKAEFEQKILAEKLAEEKAEAKRIEDTKKAKLEAERKAEADRIAERKAKEEALEKSRKENEEKLKKAQESNKLKKELESSSILEKGLTELKSCNDFNDGKKIIENYFKTLNAPIISDPDQIEILKNFVAICIKKKNNRWKKEGKQDWVLVKKWVGLEKAQVWYKELV